MKLGTVFYHDFELLDAYGPLEMFGALGDKIELVTIAQEAGGTSACNALSASMYSSLRRSDRVLSNCPSFTYTGPSSVRMLQRTSG